jgi:bifunctional DNA-binding transcriptional regulator/antitoxin component of YhaV-PrlF toxin-antitoxin module
MVTTLTRKNQTTLPAALVGQAGLEAGTRLEWTFVSPCEIRIRPLPPLSKAVELMRGRGKSLLKPGQSAVQGLLDERLQDMDVEEPV